MTPAEHYAEAERLLNLARRRPTPKAAVPIGFRTHLEVAQLAQVHATLALYRPAPRTPTAVDPQDPDALDPTLHTPPATQDPR